jgi:hypothetical protein
VLTLSVFIVALILFIQCLLLFCFGAVVAFLVIVWWKGHLDIPYLCKKIGVPEGIRTPDPRFRKPVLYPAELPRLGMVSSIGGDWIERAVLIVLGLGYADFYGGGNRHDWEGNAG